MSKIIQNYEHVCPIVLVKFHILSNFTHCLESLWVHYFTQYVNSLDACWAKIVRDFSVVPENIHTPPKEGNLPGTTYYIVDFQAYTPSKIHIAQPPLNLPDISTCVAWGIMDIFWNYPMY
jgi:hypothetical protein